MADSKKSFIAYCDWKTTFEALPDDKAGQLIKHIFSYVSDENPETNDVLINAVFANIKETLKRDLKKWEKQHNQRIDAGKKSAEIRKKNATTVERPLNDRSVSSTDSVSGNVTVNVKDNVININKRKQEFKNSLTSFYQKNKSTYPKEMYLEFYEYWSEHGEKDRKFRKEKQTSFNLERRLKTWHSRIRPTKQPNNKKVPSDSEYERLAKLQAKE